MKNFTISMTRLATVRPHNASGNGKWEKEVGIASKNGNLQTYSSGTKKQITFITNPINKSKTQILVLRVGEIATHFAHMLVCYKNVRKTLLFNPDPRAIINETQFSYN